jgi:hypothetical protein
VGLVQLIRFLVMELTHPVSNHIFDMSVAFTANYFLVGDDVTVDSDALLVTDFVNLKIKSTQFFECAHMSRICVCVHMTECSYEHEYLCFCTVFVKKRVTFK